MRFENRPLSQIRVGDSESLNRLVTTDDLYVFATASGNHNPMHLTQDDADHDGRPDAVAPGMFVASLISAVLGMKLPGPGTLYRAQILNFHERAHAGDELITTVTVSAVAPDGQVTLATEVRRKGDDALIVDGEARVIAPTEKHVWEGIEVPGLVVQRHRHFEALVARARPLPPLVTAVVAPEEEKSLGGAIKAAEESIITPILIGDPAKIAAAAAAIGADLDGFEIIALPDHGAAARRACELVNEGRAGAVMKGHLHTDDLLRPMLDKATGLRIGRRFTHVFVMDVPGQDHPILVTDAAINITPDLATKVDIVQNAIDLALSIGIDVPRVGVLSAVETVNPAIASSVDAALLSKMAERGQITGGLVDGPLAMDNAVDIGAARTKGLTSEVAGRANILVVPGLDAGNMLAKQLAYISHAEGAGLVLGARVPVILNSRSDSAMARLASCAVAALQHARLAGASAPTAAAAE
ncbi:MAG: enoyl-CoA hydratase [Roseovarius sp.]|nr:enoyl-CoA hydratase [Roseovarius sp.]MBK43959.1 enoyl-CoA hydratase [Roseovarius sp.]